MYNHTLMAAEIEIHHSVHRADCIITSSYMAFSVKFDCHSPKFVDISNYQIKQINLNITLQSLLKCPEQVVGDFFWYCYFLNSVKKTCQYVLSGFLKEEQQLLIKNVHIHSKLACAGNMLFMNILKFCHWWKQDPRLRAPLSRPYLALLCQTEHSSLLGQSGLLLQMDESVSGLVLVS